MNTKQRTAMIFVLLLSLAISSCAPGQLFGPTITPTPTNTPTSTATNTPIPPTATDTPIPPTTTNTPVPTSSKYQLKCDLAGQNADNYVIEITGETGTFQVTLNSLETNFDPGTGDFILTLNRDMLYVNSKHSYHIKGTITVGAEGVTAYDLTATGDTLGDSSQTCKKP